MPTFDVDFEVYCAECDEGLCRNAETDYTNKGGLLLNVTPCQRCLDAAKQDGRDEAAEGYDERIRDLERDLEEAQEDLKCRDTMR